MASRHWTGTPAWNISYYQDSQRTQLLNESWIVDSAYRFESAQLLNTNGADHITMKAQIKPLKSGIHTLNVAAIGEFALKVDGKLVITHSGTDASVVSQDIELEANKAYAFEIQYDGKESFTLGWNAPGNLFTDEEEYLAAAKKADAVIYFGGLSHGDDRESIDRPDMKLPNNQDEIISKLLAANEKTVVFLVAGSAVEMPWANKANAIVWGWYGGMEAGHAFADVLFGEVNPSGKMPITLPEKLAHVAPIALNDYNAEESLYSEGVFIGYRWFEQQQIKPTFAFGHGLSYTTFDVSQIKLSSQQLAENETLTVTAQVKNTGTVAGAEVVQLYLHDKQASVIRPAKELKGFDKVYLQPGESKQISIELTQRDLSFWDVNTNNWLAEAGEFEVLLGTSLDNIVLKESFTYKSH